MAVEPQEIRIYQTADGSEPFSKWYQRLKDRKGKQIIRARLARLRLGNFGDCKSVGAGVWELRIPFGPGYRVYFGREGERVVILLCGGDKSSQDRDIEKAQGYWADYQEEK